MLELSWPAVHYCIEALRTPKRPDDAIRAVAHAGGITLATAHKYLRLAHKLGLVVHVAEGRLALPARVEQPEELLAWSTLIRLSHMRHLWLGSADMPPEHGDNPFEPLHVTDPGVLRSAAALAKRLPGPGDTKLLQQVWGAPLGGLVGHAMGTALGGPLGGAVGIGVGGLTGSYLGRSKALSAEAAVILELTRLWSFAPDQTERTPPLLSAVVAHDAFKRFARLRDDAVDAFVSACMLLYGRKLVRLSIVQYATDANRPFAPFRTSLGYIKWIHSPLPYRGPRDAEPVQAPRKLASSG
jgi:hypothetical protein